MSSGLSRVSAMARSNASCQLSQLESTRAGLMGAGWVFNVAVAEWIIRRGGPGEREPGL